MADRLTELLSRQYPQDHFVRCIDELRAELARALEERDDARIVRDMFDRWVVMAVDAHDKAASERDEARAQVKVLTTALRNVIAFRDDPETILDAAKLVFSMNAIDAARAGGQTK